MAEMKKKVASRKRKEIKKVDKGQVHIQSCEYRLLCREAVCRDARREESCYPP